MYSMILVELTHVFETHKSNIMFIVRKKTHDTTNCSVNQEVHTLTRYPSGGARY